MTGKVCNQAPDSFLEADNEMEETLARSHDWARGMRFSMTFGPMSDGRIPNGEW